MAEKKASPKKPVKAKDSAVRKTDTTAKEKAAARKRAKAEAEAQAERDRWSTWDKRVRDTFIFLLGAAAFVNEIWFTAEPRPAALVAIGGMIGIPLVLAADEKRRESK